MMSNKIRTQTILIWQPCLGVVAERELPARLIDCHTIFRNASMEDDMSKAIKESLKAQQR
jgi:hypothetical protein